SLVAFVLEAEGYQVRTACDGCEGLAAIEKTLPALVLLDMKMPVMDGWEFARELHARYDHRVPIVVFTAAADAGRRVAEVGAVDWVGKPFDLDALVAVVRRTVDEAGVATDRSPSPAIHLP
ncbi:MAG: response regulator, partial [Dehalococcoidales bacterium]|nr:response regulator [Dehalococcoidales bacterium]